MGLNRGKTCRYYIYASLFRRVENAYWGDQSGLALLDITESFAETDNLNLIVRVVPAMELLGAAEVLMPSSVNFIKAYQNLSRVWWLKVVTSVCSGFPPWLTLQVANPLKDILDH
eukprot:GFKZ01010973.1.p1 GENE.GFKZ01010973.1~~GFKZ01010973.1.p1  ORF type:complete len:115 (-),score=3.15 GFKZ01010973.1:143-487(-)